MDAREHVVDYDTVAPAYDRRYEANQYDGIEECIHELIRGGSGPVAEIGCGTGHWLAFVASRFVASRSEARFVAGLDLSAQMLRQARVTAPSALLVRATADRLPWRDATFDCAFAIHALHHFRDRAAFFAEIARVLRPGGAFLTIALDPHTGRDQWWVYDYFPEALVADRERYPSAIDIQKGLSAVGFDDVETTIAQHMPAEVPFDEAERLGFTDRRSASQLMVISDDAWSAGIARLRAERPVLRADLWLHATWGRL